MIQITAETIYGSSIADKYDYNYTENVVLNIVCIYIYITPNKLDRIGCCSTPNLPSLLQIKRPKDHGYLPDLLHLITSYKTLVYLAAVIKCALHDHDKTSKN